jgi:hypothetical protein
MKQIECQIKNLYVLRIPCKAGPSSNLDLAPREVFPTEMTSDEEMERNLGEGII